MAVAYDYQAQAWISGPAADALLRAQIGETLAILADAGDGDRYAAWIGRPGEAGHIERELRRELAAL
jgi:uncharacterized protein YidB (DUF937 family)